MSLHFPRMGLYGNAPQRMLLALVLVSGRRYVDGRRMGREGKHRVQVNNIEEPCLIWCLMCEYMCVCVCLFEIKPTPALQRELWLDEETRKQTCFRQLLYFSTFIVYIFKHLVFEGFSVCLRPSKPIPSIDIYLLSVPSPSGAYSYSDISTYIWIVLEATPASEDEEDDGCGSSYTPSRSAHENMMRETLIGEYA